MWVVAIALAQSASADEPCGDPRVLIEDAQREVENFILVDAGQDCLEVFQELLKRGVIARPMKGYKFPPSLRVSIGTREENVRTIEAFAGRVHYSLAQAITRATRPSALTSSPALTSSSPSCLQGRKRPRSSVCSGTSG